MARRKIPAAAWPFRLSPDTPPDRVAEIREGVAALDSAAQYGWGHSIDFGPFRKQGLLGDNYLDVAGMLDEWGWWPDDLSGMRVADVGCFTGGLSLLMAARGPSIVYAIDEVGAHLDQAVFLAEVFEQTSVRAVKASVYDLIDHIPENSLDLVLLSGVLYHLGDMLLGLHILRRLLKPDGLLLIESNAVNDNKRSFANFGRFYRGMWWQPSGLCISDMCEFMGFNRAEVRFYGPDRCLARTRRSSDEDIPFKRGLNWHFESLADAQFRSTDPGIMAPVRSYANWKHFLRGLPRKVSRRLRLPRS
ncbi:MAG TPA: class I SAM-dependent methyltransferase [Thermoleophilia bacterium]|nr:class I SAM-dependent methyltransferase [Thermoleophilia bacterium]